MKIGLFTALIVFLADLISKSLLLNYMNNSKKVLEITDFFSIILVWNKGISFSMFANGAPYMPWVLSFLSLAIVAVLLFWLKNETNKYAIISIGLIIGGALGNVYDRIKYGAVVDFLDLHIGTWHWPAFNIADSAICLGSFVLIILCFCSKSMGKK